MTIPVTQIPVDPLRDSPTKAAANIAALAAAQGGVVGDGGAVLLGGVGAEARDLLRILLDAIDARMRRAIHRTGVVAVPIGFPVGGGVVGFGVKRVKGHEAQIVDAAKERLEAAYRQITAIVLSMGLDPLVDGAFSVDRDKSTAIEMPAGHEWAGCPCAVVMLTWTPHDLESGDAETPTRKPALVTE